MLKIENQGGVVLAYLNNLTEATVKEVLNGEYTLSFVATIDHLKTDFLYNEENLINCNDDLFRPVTIEEIHDEDDALTVAVECEHISYDLIKSELLDFNYTYKNATYVIEQCLLGTGHTLRYCDITKITDIQYTEECNSKQILSAIANNWQGEIKYYRYYVDMLKSRGANRGTGFIFGKNLKTVKRIINRTENTVSYEVDIMEGTETEELGYYELGDTVRVMDYRLNIDYECKIIEIEKDILTGLNSKVVLGDKIKDMRSVFSKSKAYADSVASNAADSAYNKAYQESAPYWNKLNAILNNLGNVIASKLQGNLSLAITNILNSTGTFEQRDNALYWQDQPTKVASSFATMWNAKGIMFARSKDSTGEWKWESALDAGGLTATAITAAALEAMKAEIVQIVAQNITGQTINGITIEGSTIYSGDRATGTYMEFASDGNIYGYYGGVRTVTILKSATGKIRLENPYDGRRVEIDPSYTYSYADSSAGAGGMVTIKGIGISCVNGDLVIGGNLKVIGSVTEYRR